jgi:hypothetical protein
MLFQTYFADAWNVFDFLIVVGSFVDIIFDDLNVIMRASNFRNVFWIFENIFENLFLFL